MSFLQTYSREIVSLCVPLVATLVANAFRARAKLIWSEHISRVMISEELVHVEVGPPAKRTLVIRTSSLFVQNLGRDASTEIEIVFNWKPLHFNLWPQRLFEQQINPDNRFIVKLPNLAPKEFVGLDLLTVNSEMPLLIQVRSLQGIAKTHRNDAAACSSEVEACDRGVFDVYGRRCDHLCVDFRDTISHAIEVPRREGL